MKIKCDKCGKEFYRKPSRVKKQNFCSIACFKTTVSRPCQTCGKMVSRCQSQMYDHVFCSSKCAKKWTSARMTFKNEDWNERKMTPAVRAKLRESHLGEGEGKGYAKIFGRHAHRLVAEQMLGRKLRP